MKNQLFTILVVTAIWTRDKNANGTLGKYRVHSPATSKVSVLARTELQAQDRAMSLVEKQLPFEGCVQGVRKVWYVGKDSTTSWNSCLEHC